MDMSYVDQDGHRRCVLEADERTVHVTLNASFFEGVEGSCGGNERETDFKDLMFEVPADTTKPVSIGRL